MDDFSAKPRVPDKLRRPAGAQWIAMFVVLLAGSACTSHDGSQNRSEPEIAPTVVHDLRTFKFPLDQYRLQFEDLLLEREAQKLLFTNCMMDFGFDQILEPEPPGRLPVTGYERLYGLVDLEQAEANGYHVPEATLEVSGQPQDPVPLRPAGYTYVAFGEGPTDYEGKRVPKGGCYGDAKRRIASGTEHAGDYRLGDRLYYESIAEAMNDSRVAAVDQAWSACMERSGFHYPNPLAAMDDPAFATAHVTPREVQVASADVQCKIETNLVNVKASVDIAYQLRAIEENAEALNETKAMIDVRKRNVARILAEQ